VYGRLNVNVALKRPTFMSSVLYDALYGGYFSGWKAVDGNSDPVAYQVDNSCIHTLGGTHPWWAVDLGAALAVVGVLFTNRADGWGNYDDDDDDDDDNNNNNNNLRLFDCDIPRNLHQSTTNIRHAARDTQQPPSRAALYTERLSR